MPCRGDRSTPQMLRPQRRSHGSQHPCTVSKGGRMHLIDKETLSATPRNFGQSEETLRNLGGLRQPLSREGCPERRQNLLRQAVGRCPPSNIRVLVFSEGDEYFRCDNDSFKQYEWQLRLESWLRCNRRRDASRAVSAFNSNPISSIMEVEDSPAIVRTWQSNRCSSSDEPMCHAFSLGTEEAGALQDASESAAQRIESCGLASFHNSAKSKLSKPSLLFWGQCAQRRLNRVGLQWEHATILPHEASTLKKASSPTVVEVQGFKSRIIEPASSFQLNAPGKLNSHARPGNPEMPYRYPWPNSSGCND